MVITTDREVNGLRGRFVVDLVWPGPKPRRLVASLWLQLAAEAGRARRDALVFFYNRANKRLARLAGLPVVTVNRKRLPQRPSVRAPEPFLSTQPRGGRLGFGILCVVRLRLVLEAA